MLILYMKIMEKGRALKQLNLGILTKTRVVGHLTILRFRCISARPCAIDRLEHPQRRAYWEVEVEKIH